VRQPLNDETLCGIAGNDERTPLRLSESSFFGVETDASHPMSFIRTMALKTVLGEDGTYLAIEVNPGLQRGG
jgi:hypothetical protein